MRESKDRERENIEFFFFGLSDFYLFFSIFRKIKNIIKRVFWKKGKFKVLHFAPYHNYFSKHTQRAGGLRMIERR